MQRSTNDPLWRDAGKGFNAHITGSNCFSFAVGDFRRQRPHKSVPGNLTQHVLSNEQRYSKQPSFKAFKARYARTPFRDGHGWRSCPESVKRLLMDGYAASVIHEFMGERNVPRTVITGPLKGMATRKTPPGKRLFAMVVESGKGTGQTFGSTDFHFAVRYRLPVEDVYRVRLVAHSVPALKRRKNPYQRLGVNPFLSDARLRAHLEDGHPMLDPVHRACENTRIHAERFPDYALGSFPDPLWIFNLVPRTKRLLDQRYAEMKERIGHLEELVRVMDLARAAVKRGAKRVRGSIGLFAHKSGWATGAQNADGDGRLIFDIERAQRKHGTGFAYDTFCGYFMVRENLGMSSPPHALLRM
jgi:hypothetical protein